MPGAEKRKLERPYLRFALAAVVVLAAFLLRQTLVLHFALELPAFITFYPAVMVVALLFGLWPGLLATALAAALAGYWTSPPLGTFAFASSSQAVAPGIFFAMGIFMSLLAERYRRLKVRQHEVALNESREKLQKQAQVALRESRSFAQSTFDALASHICVLDAAGNIIAVNRAWREFGRANRRVGSDEPRSGSHNGGDLNKSVNYLAVLDMVQGPESVGAAEVAAGIRAVLQGERELFSAEYAFHSHGEQRWFLCKVTRFLSQGLSRVAVEHIDISERRRVEDALRTSEAKLQGVIGSAMDAIISVDEQQCIVAFNRAAEAVFRCAASEAVGSTLDRFIPMSLREGHREHIRRFGSEGVTARSMNSPGILTAIRSNGEEFPIEATISRLQTGGENLYTVILRDVTKRRQVEQALLRSEKLASVGRMAASIAHEINNPLGAVTNLLFLVQEIDDLPESARRYLEIADGELKRVAHITRQSLGFYREGNAAALTSVNAVMESAVDLLKSKIAAKRAVIEREWDGDVEITAVAGELRQVFSNLLANSLDAIDEGGTIKLRVSAGTASGKGHRCVRVTIADNGKGIPASSRKHLFEPFFTTKGTIGTGLGLWVSKRIVGHHGGSIQMRSNASGSQRGTIFSIVLPIEPASPAERTQSATV
jgi:PAS domain S-box-containing protein